MFGRHLHMIRNSGVIPLVDGGSDPVAVLALADFSLAMTKVVEASWQLALNLFNRTEPPMREIVETVLRLDHRRALIVPVPYSLAASGVAMRGTPAAAALFQLRQSPHYETEPETRSRIELTRTARRRNSFRNGHRPVTEITKMIS